MLKLRKGALFNLPIFCRGLVTYESISIHVNLFVTMSSSNYFEEIVDVSKYKRNNYNQNEIMSYKCVQICNLAVVRGD